MEAAWKAKDSGVFLFFFLEVGGWLVGQVKVVEDFQSWIQIYSSDTSGVDEEGCLCMK